MKEIKGSKEIESFSRKRAVELLVEKGVPSDGKKIALFLLEESASELIDRRSNSLARNARSVVSLI